MAPRDVDYSQPIPPEPHLSTEHPIVMSATPFTPWDDTEIPAVSPTDLSAALALWLERERQGLVIAGAGVATQSTIDAQVIGMSSHPARGLAVLLRMRCLVEAMSSRRFRHLVRGNDTHALAHLVSIAASQRLNPRWGMSPLRLAWAMAADNADAMRKAA